MRSKFTSMRLEIARKSVKAEGGLTARLTSRADTKVGLSDLVVKRVELPSLNG